MMSALEFVRCYDPKFMMPEDHVDYMLNNSKKRYDETQLEQVRENMLADYLQKFKTRLQEILSSSDLTSKFFNVPNF